MQGYRSARIRQAILEAQLRGMASRSGRLAPLVVAVLDIGRTTDDGRPTNTVSCVQMQSDNMDVIRQRCVFVADRLSWVVNRQSLFDFRAVSGRSCHNRLVASALIVGRQWAGRTPAHPLLAATSSGCGYHTTLMNRVSIRPR